MLMKTKTNVALSIVAVTAVIVLFASGPLAASQAQAFGGFHRGFGFHHFGFHRGFGFPGWGWGGGFGGFGGCGCC
jgi:hypothetical protein